MDQSLEIQKKARILLTTNMILGGLMLFLGLVMLATGAVIVGATLTIVTTMCLATMFLIRSGRYRWAVNFFLAVGFSAVFFAIKFDQYVDIYETYVMGTLGTFLLIATSLIGYDRRQPLIISGLLIASIGVLYLTDILPKDGGIVTVLHIQSLVTPFLMIVCSGIYGGIILSLQKELVTEAENQAESSRRKFEELEKAVRDAQSTSLDIGNRLSISSSQAMKMVRQLQDYLLTIKREVGDLSREVRTSSDANQKVGEATAGVRTSLDHYRSSVEKVTGSMEKIAAAINGISGSTRDKKGELDQLVTVSEEGRGKMNQSQQSIEKVSGSSTDILNMVTIINDVANRTNMLALNASIEASHAGEAGKGFAVVASEIRKLASETNASSKKIIENVRSSISDIQNSRVIIHELEEVYGQITIEIRTVAELLQNIIWDVTHVSEGTRDIVQTLDSVNAISSAVGQAMEKVGQLMDNSSRGVAAVMELTGRILGDIESMLGIFTSVVRETEKVDGIGRENIDYISRFYDSIKTIER